MRAWLGAQGERNAGGVEGIRRIQSTPEGAVADAVRPLGGDVASRLDEFDITGALERIWDVVRVLNREVETTAPWHEKCRPDLVEAEAIQRVATLAQLADCPLYVVHLSSARGLEVIRRARAEGWRIHAETCPQYLLLDRRRYEEENGHRYIASPPLRMAAFSPSGSPRQETMMSPASMSSVSV